MTSRPPQENNLETMTRFEDGCIEIIEERRREESVGVVRVVIERTVIVRERVFRLLRLGRRDEQ